MIDGLQIITEQRGERWMAFLEGGIAIEAYGKTREEAIDNWKNLWGFQYGICMHAKRYTVILPWADSKD